MVFNEIKVLRYLFSWPSHPKFMSLFLFYVNKLIEVLQMLADEFECQHSLRPFLQCNVFEF